MEKLTDHQLKVAIERYFMDGETKWEDLVNRITKEMVKVDNDEKYLSDIHNSIGNMEFLPAGRILRNIGKIKGSMMNCNLVPIEDSIEEIGQAIKNSLSIWAYGGGVGINFSSLRPKGTPLSTKGGQSSGLVSFLQAIDSLANTIESGGQRRAAGMAICDISHPEVEDFIDVKLEKGLLSHFNLSVAVNSDFLEAVEKDDNWDLKFSEKVYETVRARMLWEKILKNMIRSGEPGLINWDYLVKNNSYYFSPIVGTNPCITGDMLIVTIDENRNVKLKSIKQLSEEAKDVPVLSLNISTKKVETKMMRNIRKTGENKKILKIFFDNGNYIRCTENHKLYMKDLNKIGANELKIGDIIHDSKTKIINIIEDSNEDVYNGTVDDNHNYYIFSGNSNNYDLENVHNYILVANCGEQALPNFGSCDLGAVNLTKFVIGKTNATNWKKLEEVIKTSVRFLDNVIDLNYFPVNELEIEAKKSRRIGLGIMGLGDFLLLKKIRYGSERCLKELEELFRFFRNKCYETSIELARTKKPFPMFDKVAYGKASFIRKLPARLRLEIKEFGIRNCNITTTAPTGTTSLIAGTTSGIEPIIYKANRRNDRISERIYIHPLYEKYLLDKHNGVINQEDSGDYFVDIMDLNPEDHLEVQSLAQQYIDSSISKTINLPSDYNSDSLGKLLLEYIHSLKGVTVYRDGSREGQVCNLLSEKEALDYILEKNKDKTNEIGHENLKCHNGKCDL